MEHHLKLMCLARAFAGNSPGVITCRRRECYRYPALRVLWGQYYMIPEDYQLPKVTTGVIFIWSVWWLGNKEDRIPALRKLKPSKWSSRDGQKRFCELRRLMLVLEVEGRTNHGMVDNSMTDLRAVRSMYKMVKEVLHSIHPGQRKHRSAHTHKLMAHLRPPVGRSA